MEHIYHERQEGSLCAQHCLNNLLQGQIFSAIDLADIGNQMDEEEQRRMAEQGVYTDDFQKYLQQPSENMDDSGMFSVQVISAALRVWELRLVNFKSADQLAVAARNDPVDQCGYICNFREHWFSIRKLGLQWFNLNSLLTYPELISDMYLSLFLKQLETEGYSIFIVDGVLPPCVAHDALLVERAVQKVKPKLLSEVRAEMKQKEAEDLKTALAASLSKASGMYEGGGQQGESSCTEDDDLQAAIRLSLTSGEDEENRVETRQSNSSDEDLKRAIALSLEASGHSSQDDSPSKLSSDDSLSKTQQHQEFPKEDYDLEKGLQASLDSSLLQVEIPEDVLNMDEVRKRRLKYLEKKKEP